jgi:phosphoglycerate kinase
MSYRKLHVTDLDVRGKRVLTRVDFNVPLTADGEVTDDTRIRRALPTISYILESGGRAVLASHRGRPKGERVPSMSLKPAAARLSELLGREVVMGPDCVGDTTEGLAARMSDGDVLLLENLRFHDGETKNESDFARRLARMGDVYVNDAFGTAHRAHASTVGVTAHFDQRAMGLLIENELENLAKATDDPRTPYVAILGGAKVSDKIGVIDNLLPKVDELLVGGGMAFTFLAARGKGVGDSLLERDRIDTAAALLAKSEEMGKALVLPTDIVVADDVGEGAASKVVGVDGIEPGWRGVDIGPQTVDEFARKISRAQTIVWNGPLGVFEIPAFAVGTLDVAEAVAARTDEGAVSIIGGGDSAAAVVAAGLEDRVSHISTGGGASLMFMEGKPLPAIEALTDA